VTMLIAAAVVGYVCGSLSFATLAARRAGQDLRSVGSGNPGATNAGRLLGRRTGVTVAVLDVLKGLLPAAGFGLLDHEAGLVAGIAAVLGHVTSPWLHGHGGKGVATAAGAIIGSHPGWGLVVVAVWLVALAATRWIALASVSAAVTTPIIAVVLGRGWPEILWACAIAGVVVVRHRSNYVRWHAARHADAVDAS
jgi:acyl phosphate:glycerol-3-phosphate acyltransferase